MTATPVALLFTDLVESTALLQRAGDEGAQRVLQAHRQLLREALAGHGGREVKWLGDGLLATFGSVAEGVRCAVTMAQQARHAVAGERLGLRLGLHVGEVLPDDADYVGTPVVLARRLCDRATSGQILCSGVVVELLRGRQGFEFVAVGPVALKGFAEPMAAYAVAYQPDPGVALLRRTPFIGRVGELRRLTQRLEHARAGHGGVLLLVGEPGIGKTRTLEEFAETARAQGTLVLWGRCFEGEAARPYGPFVEALGEYARTAAPEVLRADLGLHAVPLTRLVPGLRTRLPDLPEPAPLEPYEERVRLLDAVAQGLLALAARVPTVLVLDDLHWADPGTVALLRHVARFAPRGRLLVLGAYRDAEVDRQHPLADALGTLPRETSYEQLALPGLDAGAVQDLLDAIAQRDVPPAWAEALTQETRGNPFFLREMLLHLVEEGALGLENASAAPALETLRLPDTVRQVITRRLERLSDATNQLLRVAAAFTGGIDFEVARRVAGLEEPEALGALDAALGAQLLVPAGEGTAAYDFTHALIRHTLYGALSPSRQVRLHRRLAEEMERRHGEDAGEYALEIARQWHRSAALPGAERGVGHCLVATDRAERVAAHEDAAAALRMALDLLPTSDARRARILARLGLALAWSRAPEEAVRVAREAGELLAASEGSDAAADYLAAAAEAVYGSGTDSRAWALAEQGLRHVGGRRDATWALLTCYDLDRREASDPEFPGIPLDIPERYEVSRILLANPPSWEGFSTFPGWQMVFTSRDDVRQRANRTHSFMAFHAGEYARASELASEAVRLGVERGQLAGAALDLGVLAQCQSALGNLGASHEAFERAVELADRIGNPAYLTVQLSTVPFQYRGISGEGYETPVVEGLLASAKNAPEVRWLRAAIKASAALSYARAGRGEDALRLIARVLPAIERAAGWAMGYTPTLYWVIEALWVLERREHVEVLERNLREKTLAPDFRCQHTDARLALARLCALTGRDDEARAWFDRARRVLDEQGARPLRAIVDYDEALMYAHRAAPGDDARARPLLGAALRQFQAVGMPGWIRRAETLAASVADGRDGPASQAPPSAAPTSEPKTTGLFRREGDVWAITYAGRTIRLRDTRGFGYLAVLLRHPDRELHATDVVRLAGGDEVNGRPHARPDQELATSIDLGHAGTVLDPRAREEYRTRLAELREDLSESEQANDLGRAAGLSAEIEALVEQLTAAARGRTVASHAERARLTVTKGIKGALARIAASHPELGRHLDATVRRGYFCVYRPGQARPVRWSE